MYNKSAKANSSSNPASCGIASKAIAYGLDENHWFSWQLFVEFGKMLIMINFTRIEANAHAELQQVT
jgi:hypothetical protein